MSADCEPVPGEAAAATSPGWRRSAPAVLFWAGMLLLAFGFVDNALWREIGWGATWQLGGLGMVSLAVAYVAGRLLRCRFATALLSVWLVALAGFAGLGSSLAVVLIAAAAMGVGSCFVPAGWRGRAALSTVAGLALMAGVVGWTLPFRIHHVHITYLVVLLALVAWRGRELVGMLRQLPPAWSAAVAAAPVAAGAAVTVLGLVSTYAWWPTMGYDDLAYHLALPSQLASLGYYQMNAASNVWALAAWASDVLHAITWVVAGAESRGVVDALWFALSAILTWRLCEELELKPALRWLAVALFAACALVAVTLMSMQTEGPTIAVLLGLALLIQRTHALDARMLRVLAVLFGLLLGLKVSNVWFAAPLGLWCLWQSRGRLAWRALPGALLLGLLVAGSSYVYAFVLTGNPVLPVFNGIFHSAYFPDANFYDDRWHSGFGWNIVWRVVFHSSKYYEGHGVALSFALIGLGGCFFVALTRPRSRGLALVGAAAFLLPLAALQYSRYALPGLALLVPAMLCGLPAAQPIETWRARSRSMAMWALVVLGMLFVTSLFPQYEQDVTHAFLRGGDQSVLAQFSPTRRIAEVIRDRYGRDARTLMLDPTHPFAAELAGRAFVVNWYDPQLHALNGQPDASGSSKWLREFDLTGANLVVTKDSGVPDGVATALAAWDAQPVYAVGGFELWQLRGNKVGVGGLTADHSIALSFDTTGAPAHRTLVHGEIEFACDRQAAKKGHIVVGWRLVEAGGRRQDQFGWAVCGPGGRARSEWDLAVRDKVTSFTVQVQPEPAIDMGLQVLSSRGSLRNDLTEQRDLARQLRHRLKFWKKPKHAMPVVAP